MSAPSTSIFFEQQIVRTVVSLCSLASRTPSDDVRDDVRDAAVALVRIIWTSFAANDRLNSVRHWCVYVANLLDQIRDIPGVAPDAAGAAYVQVLRLRALVATASESSSVSAMEKDSLRAVAPRKSGRQQQALVEFIRENPGARTSAIVGHFAVSISPRSVKRYLRDLIASGTIRRAKDGSSVVYEVA